MPTPVITNNQLGWAYLSSVMSNIRPVESFLKGLFFRGTPEFLTTESAELSYYNDDDQKMAPFVEVNSEAIPVGGRSTTFANVSTPNIRIKRPMEAYQVFLRRQPGTGIFVTGGGQISAARQQAINDDLDVMDRKIQRREEWMCSRLLTGTNSTHLVLTYSVQEGANFTISTPRPANHVVTAATTWASSTTVELDFHNVKSRMAKSGQTPTHCIMGSTAAANFITNAGVKALLNNKGISAGDLQLQNQFSESGAIYLGTFCGISCWQYQAEFIDDSTGSATPHIGAEQAIFLNASPSNGAQWFYGAIPDHDAFEQGAFVGKVFSKSWTTKDPSVRNQLVHTRPLPHVRRPASIVVMDTVP